MDATRQARMDLGGLSKEDVAEALELARVPIASEIARYRHVLARGSASLGAEDLVALGRIAALEAVRTFDADRGASLRTWIGQRVGWRIREAIQELARTEVPVGDAGDVYAFRECIDGKRDDSELSYEPLEALEAASERAWVLRSLRPLSQRQRVLLVSLLGDAELKARPFAELARQCGVHPSRVTRDLQDAVRVLREIYERNGGCAAPPAEEALRCA